MYEFQTQKIIPDVLVLIPRCRVWPCRPIHDETWHPSAWSNALPTLAIVDAAGVAVDATAAAHDTVAAGAAVVHPIATSAAVVANAAMVAKPSRLQLHAVTIGDGLPLEGRRRRPPWR